MWDIVVNRLRLNQLYIGYRVQTFSNTGDTVYFDVSNDMLPQFLKLFGDVNISKGTVIDGKEVNGMFITDNETNVYEVETISVGRELLDKHYFCVESVASELLAESDEVKSELELIKAIESAVQNRRVSLRDLPYGYFGDIPIVYNSLNKAAEGIKCDILAFPHQEALEGNMKFQCNFIYFDDFLAFLHNMLISLNRKVITVSAGVKSYVDTRELPVITKSKVSCNCSRAQFIASVLEKLGISGLKNIKVMDYQVFWNDCFTDFMFEDDLYIAQYYVKYPGYDQNDENPKDAKYRAKFFKPVSEKSKTGVSRELTVTRSRALVKSFIDTISDEGKVEAFKKLLRIGFTAGELAKNFGFSKSDYQNWKNNATAEDVAKAKESLAKQGKDPIPLDRYKELLTEIIDYVQVGENLSTTINNLLDVGFTVAELVQQFNFSKSDVERYAKERDKK